MSFLDTLFSQIDLFILILLRISGYVLVSPLWGRQEVQRIFKVCFCIYFAYIMILTGKAELVTPTIGIGQFFLVCILETFKGVLVGYISSIFFSIFLIAGQIIDMHIGFQMGGILDKNYGIKVSQTAKLLNIASMIVFLRLNGHLQLIKIMENSYSLNQIGSGISFESLYNIVVSAFSFSVVIALKIALPVILIVLFVNVILGTLVKFVPQLNIFAVGIPLKIVVGLFSIIFLVEPFIKYLDFIFNHLFDVLSRLYV